MITRETLQQSIKEASEAVLSREHEVGAAQARLAEAERELKLLAELARLRGWEPNELGTLNRFAASSADGSTAERPRRSPSPARSALLSAVIDILAERGKPMQIRELMEAVQQRGVAIPGSGQQANLIAYISRDERIVRPRRGFYALRERSGQGAKPKAQRKRRRTRRRSGAKA